MIKIPLSEILNKIEEKSGMTEAEIRAKIQQKVDDLSGMVSEEGAAHIIANSLGIKLIQDLSGKLKINQVLSGMRSVETIGKVTRVFELRQFKTEIREGKVASFTMGDETGTIRITLWNEQAEQVQKIKEGMIIKIKGGYSRDNNGRVEIHLNDKSQLTLDPAGEEVGEVKETVIPTVRKKISELAEGQDNIEVLGTVVQTFNPTYFELCPTCGKRARPREDQYICDAHGPVEPTYSLVVNAVIDDGTGNIRASFFRNQAAHLFSKTAEELVAMRTETAKLDELKNEVLGQIIKIIGKTKINSMNNNLEFQTRFVDPKPDPKEEIAKLEEI